MFASFGWRQRLILAFGGDRPAQRDEVLKRAVVVDFDGDPLESLVTAMRTKTLLFVERQLETAVTPSGKSRTRKEIEKVKLNLLN